MTRLTTDLHPLLTASVLNSLFNKSIYTPLAFVRKKPGILSSLTGLQYNDILKIRNKILAQYSSTLKSGDKLYQELISRCAVLPSGIKQLDSLLEGGGFLTGNIYELCGFEACGKTQICMTTALNICLATSHQVFYMDTKHDVSSQRLLKMLLSQNVTNIGTILSNIKITYTSDSYQILNNLHFIKKALSQVKDHYLGFKIIIIDSLSSPFQGFDSINEGLPILNNIANLMNFLVSQYNLVILLTNFVTLWESENSENENVLDTSISKVSLPALGKYWTHVPSTRLMIHRENFTDECCITVLKSPCHGIRKSVKIKITDAGVV